MADLTRFDFHAVRFVYSEDVQKMTAEEVGQYVLLMCQAWLGGKEATLPANPKLLSQYARCKSVSPLVMSKWEPQGDGRLFNRRLSEEWDNTINRSDVAKRCGQSTSTIKADAARENGKLGGRPANNPTGKPKETQQGNPTHTIPYQSKPNQVEEYIYGNGDFKNISTRFISFFGIRHSHNQRHLERYATACQKYGEDRVLDCFDSWAASAEWIRNHKDRQHGLNFFWKPLDEFVAADEMKQEREKPEPVEDFATVAAEATAARQAEAAAAVAEYEKIQNDPNRYEI